LDFLFSFFFFFFFLLCSKEKGVPTTAALSAPQVQQLASKLEEILDSSPTAEPTQAFHYMGCLCVAFLTFVIPQRSQILKSLKIGETLVQQPDKRWRISAPSELTKNKMTLDDYELPAKFSVWLDKYINVYRPLLMTNQQDHAHLFVTTGGEPRTDINAIVKSVVKRLIDVDDVSPHQFRSVIASAIFDRGGAATVGDLNALSRSMLTSTSTLQRHYIRVKPAADYARAQAQLDTVLGKRPRDEPTSST
jgi:hypothetical protein